MEAKIKITEKLIWDLFPAVNSKRGRNNKEYNIKGFVYVYNKYADYFAIDTVEEVCHFIAQVAHESDQFNAFEEYASGSAYNGRKDLGNIYPGDGEKYKGRGAIQTTGRINYIMTGNEILKLPFLTTAEKKLFENDGILKNPKLLQDHVWGSLSAFIYWAKKDLNNFCLPPDKKVSIKRLNSKGWYNYICFPIEAITRKVNGGMNGYEERVKYYNKLKLIIK